MKLSMNNLSILFFPVTLPVLTVVEIFACVFWQGTSVLDFAIPSTVVADFVC